MRAQEFVREKVSPETTQNGFEDEQELGNDQYTLKAKGYSSTYQGKPINMLEVQIIDNEYKERIAFVDFICQYRPEDKEPYLVSTSTYVKPEYRGQGLAKIMYRYANKLGNDIEPSRLQTQAGKDMWKGLTKSVRQLPQLPQPVSKPAKPNLWQRLSKAVGTKSKQFAESVDADKILQYVKREHAPEEFNIDYAITDHPEWELKNIPISRLKLDPDGEEKDPYGRVNWVDYDTVRDLTPKIGSVLKTSPIVVDRDGWIIDGNHRATAAVEAGLDSVPAYVPVAMHDTSEAVNPDIVKSNFHAEKNIDIEGIGPLKLTAQNINTDTPPQFRVDVTNDQGQTIGYFRFVVMDWEPEPKYRIFSRFAKQKDPYVIGGNVNVWKDYQRRGIARAVYQWIKSMGNDIKPSTTQTSAGQAMWRGFAADPIEENFADKKVKGKSRPGRVKRAGASCAGSVTDLRARAKKYGGERGKMYHWCANMKAGKKK